MKMDNDKIIDYLEGLLSKEERIKFEAQLKEDDNLQQEIKLYKEGKELTDNFNQYYHQEDDIDYNDLKKKAFKENIATINIKDNLLEKIKKTFLNISYPQLSAVMGSMCIAFFLGSISFKNNIAENYEWQIAESNLRGEQKKNSVTEWQIKNKGISISVKAIPGYDNENAIYLKNGESINSSHNFFTKIKSKTNKTVIIFRDKSYLINPGEELGIELETSTGKNDIILLCLEEQKTSKFLFSFNISD